MQTKGKCMAKQWMGFALVLVSLSVLVVSGNLAAIPVLLPFAVVTGYLIVRLANRHSALLPQRKKR
jgi:hypothetical protein